MRKVNLGGVNLVHYTPVLSKMFENTEELNESLKEQILEKMKTSKGVSKSNEGGWHSDLDLLYWLDPKTKDQLISIIVGSMEEMLMSLMEEKPSGDFNLKITAWANVSEKGNFNTLHTHPGSVWSGVYYIDDGGDPESRILFPDTRIESHMIESPINPFKQETLELPPISGMSVIFPSWLQHSVRPYNGTKQRISIAYNIST